MPRLSRAKTPRIRKTTSALLRIGNQLLSKPLNPKNIRIIRSKKAFLNIRNKLEKNGFRGVPPHKHHDFIPQPYFDADGFVETYVRGKTFFTVIYLDSKQRDLNKLKVIAAHEIGHIIYELKTGKTGDDISKMLLETICETIGGHLLIQNGFPRRIVLENAKKYLKKDSHSKEGYKIAEFVLERYPPDRIKLINMLIGMRGLNMAEALLSIEGSYMAGYL